LSQRDQIFEFAKRTAHLKPEGAYHVLGRALQLEKEGREIIHFEIGQPDFPTFENICEAGIQAIRSGKTRYTPPAGMMELRAAIAEDAGRRRGISILPQEVVISPGGKPNLFFPTLALVEEGDEVMYPDPGFPTYEAMILVAGGIPVAMPLLEENDFSLDLDAFDRLINPRTKLVILNSPSNPTGGVLSWEALHHIAEQVQRYDCWVLSDEIYSRLVYDNLTAPSIASLTGMKERTIIVDGFSKTYSMTGWRLGFGIMPVALAQQVELLLTHSIGATAHFTQFAGLEAILGPQEAVNEMVAEFQRRREVMVSGLNSLPGFRCRQPQGAFYAFPNIREIGQSSAELADRLLEEAGVALLPGSAFGAYGEGYLRLSYATGVRPSKKGWHAFGAFYPEG